jgi:hypothetical protein
MLRMRLDPRASASRLATSFAVTWAAVSRYFGSWEAMEIAIAGRPRKRPSVAAATVPE